MRFYTLSMFVFFNFFHRKGWGKGFDEWGEGWIKGRDTQRSNSTFINHKGEGWRSNFCKFNHDSTIPTLHFTHRECLTPPLFMERGWKDISMPLEFASALALWLQAQYYEER